MTYSLGLFQDGAMVAAVYCDRLKVAGREICHLAMGYVQDGPVEIRVLDEDGPESTNPADPETVLPAVAPGGSPETFEGEVPSSDGHD